MASHSALRFLASAAVPAVLAACGNTPQKDPDSLYERRLAVIKGTAPGITLIAPRAAAPAASAASGVAAGSSSSTSSGTATGGTAGAATASATPATGLQLDLPPPTGLPPAQIKNLDRKDLGITLPSALSASQPARQR